MKKYETPEIDIEKFRIEDVMKDSNKDPDEVPDPDEI